MVFKRPSTCMEAKQWTGAGFVALFTSAFHNQGQGIGIGLRLNIADGLTRVDETVHACSSSGRNKQVGFKPWLVPHPRCLDLLDLGNIFAPTARRNDERGKEDRCKTAPCGVTNGKG